MSVELKIVNSHNLLKEYIYLPSMIYKSYQNFVPSFYKDEFEFHNRTKNKNLQSSETILAIAYKYGKQAGRIMGIIYHPWNESNNKKWARFYQFDCINDEETASSLLGFVEEWALRQGMTHMIGPFGFSDKDPQGVQVEGFEFPPVIASVSHEPQLGRLIDGNGYNKFKDCISYKVEIPETMPEIYKKTYNRILKHNSLHLIEFRTRSTLKPFFHPVLQLMNEGYKNIFGFIPMSSDDIQRLADQYLSVLDPRLVKIVVNDERKPVAFVIAMANISKGMQQARGRLFPFGFIKILLEMRRSTQLDLLLGAVSESYRGRGLTALLGISLMNSARKKGLRIMDSHLILEENKLMRAEVEKIGGVQHKRYRIYIKSMDRAQNSV